MITVLDTNNIAHQACPRCGGYWKAWPPRIRWGVEGVIRGFDCSNCSMRALIDREASSTYFFCVSLFLDDKNYEIYWNEDRCLVYVRFTNKAGNIYHINLPTLPFNITIQKLQTYLVFS